MRRDAVVSRKLKKEGWKVIRVWEHDMKNNTLTTVRKVESAMYNSVKTKQFGGIHV